MEKQITEKKIEDYLRWSVERMGGKTWKFTSPAHRGVSDRIACLPDGSTWFIEVKKPTGELSALQILFGAEMQRLNQKYVCLWSKTMVDEWAKSLCS